MFEVGVLQEKKTRKLARISVVLAVLVATCGIGIGLSAAAPDPCQDVWQGLTPKNPLTKTANPTSVHPGDTVTYTFGWTSTGDVAAALEDCYRVDDGSNDTLNALVTGFYHSVDVPNVGASGTAQTYAYTITIPNDSSLVGHSIVNRAKMTHGSVESRTGLVEVPITCAENCGGGGTTTGSSTGDTSGTSTGGTSTGDTSGTSTGGTSTGGTSGTSTGETSTGGTSGTTTGTSTGSTVKNEVLGRTIARKPLATTGSETTALAWIGSLMLMVGLALRFGKFGPREIYAAASDSPTTADLLLKAIRSRSRDWTCRR